jgi:hypothetical protein
MSSDLAIAGVTATLRHLLKRGVVDHVTLGDQGPVSVTAMAPDLINTENADLADQINLYMYHVAPNPGWRNAGLPSRGVSGARTGNPPLALDLYYVVTAYSQKELYADVLLGYAMQFLHEVPVLTQRAIRHALNPAPIEVSFIKPEDLLAQVEQIKIAPHALEADDMYKLWMAFQTTYRPSAAYHVSVVLIEDPQPARSALPVLMIGEPDASGRPGGVTSNANLSPSTPTLTSLTPPATNGPVIRLGESLTINGFHLADRPASVSLMNLITSERVPLTVPTTVPPSTAQLTAQMPVPGAAPAGLRSGACTIQAVVGTGVSVRGTNALPLAVAPTITKMVAGGPTAKTVLTLTCAPPIWPGQQVSALIGDTEVYPAPWTGTSTDTLTFTFDATAFTPPGPNVPVAWIRLRVDGVDSVLVDQSTDPPHFDPTQKVPL